jgi:hypothetical protein
LADRANEFLEDLSDHFGGHPKTAGRTFTGGAGRNLKAESGDQNAGSSEKSDEKKRRVRA